jgi:hypothetical protein
MSTAQNIVIFRYLFCKLRILNFELSKSFIIFTLAIQSVDMEALKNLPVGLQNFESLRKNGYLYVDKTALVYELVSTGKYYFLSRPRRFGKSMLQSTLYAYFEGKKELFEGLAIEKLEKDWIKYPVLHLDLNLIKRGDCKTSIRFLIMLCANGKRFMAQKNQKTH